MSGKHKLNDSPGLTTEAKKGKTDSPNVGDIKATPSPSNLKVYPRRSRTPSAKAVDIMIDESIERDRLTSTKTPPTKPKTTPKRTQTKKSTAAMRNKALIDNNISPVTVQLSPLKKPTPLTPEEKKNKPASSLLDFKRPIVSKKLPAPLTPEKMKDNKKETVKDMEVDKGSDKTVKQSSDQLPSLGTISKKSSDINQTESSDVTSVLSITDKLPSLRPITMTNDQKSSPLVANVDVPPGSTQQKNVADINETQTATVIDMTQSTNNVELLSSSSNVEQQLQNIPMLENGNNIHVISDKIILAADLGDGSGTNYLITIDPATQAILERDGKLVVVSKVVENENTENGTSMNTTSEPTSTQDTVQEPDSSTKIVIISNETTDAVNSETQTTNLTDLSSNTSSYISPTTIPISQSSEIGIGKPDTTTKILHESDSTTTYSCTSSSDTVPSSIDQPKETNAHVSISTVDKPHIEVTAPEVIPSSQTTNETSIGVIPEKSDSLIKTTSHESSEITKQEPDTTTTSNSSTETNTAPVHTSNIALSNPPINPKNVEADSSTKVETITKEAIVTPSSEKNVQKPDSNTSSALETDNDPSKINTQAKPTVVSDLPDKQIVSTTDTSTPKQQIRSPTSDDNIIHLESELICLPDEDDSKKQGILAISGTNVDDPAILVSKTGETVLDKDSTVSVSKTEHASAVSASENGDGVADTTENNQKNSDNNSALALEKNGQINLRKEQGIVIPTEIDLFGDKSNPGDSDNTELKNSVVPAGVSATVSSKLSENTVSSNDVKDG